MTKKFSGVIVPAITPLNSDFTIDTAAVKGIMQRFAANGLHPLLLGTTGESPLVNASDSELLLRTAIANRGGQQQIYAGIVGNQVQELVDRSQRYFELGADVVVARALGATATGINECIAEGAECLRSLADECGIPLKLSDIGIPEAAIPELVATAMQVTRLLNNNPRKMTPEDAENIYRQLF